MPAAEHPPVLSVVGRKNSGKTTLLVALAAELKARGLRVASVKHGHHQFEIDHPGRDSWRHFHEGGVEAVLMVSDRKVALVMRQDEEAAPDALIRHYYGGRGYDLVLVEGYKRGPFPKVEVYRSALHDGPIHDPTDPRGASHLVAVVTDLADLAAACPVIPLDPLDPRGSHVDELAEVVMRWLGRGEA